MKEKSTSDQANLLFVIDSLVTGGAEQVFADLAALMHGYIKFDILLISLQTTESYDLPPNTKKIYLNRKNKWSLQSFWRCYRTIRKYKVVHIHMRHTFRYVSSVARLFQLRSKLIFHDHFGSIEINKKQPFKEYRFLKPDVYIGVSDQLREWAIQVWGIPREHTHTFINLPSTRFLQRLSTRIQPNAEGIVMVGNVKPIKNQKFAIELAKAINMPLTLIGKNQDAEYSKYVSKASMDQAIRWMQDQNDVSQILKNYKIGICCSISESGPLVILEYLLCGLPFIAFKTGGIAEIVSRYFPEYFVEDFNIDTWKDRIFLLLNREREVDKARVEAMLSKEFSPEIYRRRLLEIYEI